MGWMTGLRFAKDDERFREKIAEMVTQFCLEASVLIAVLGILEAAIAWKGFPPFRDILYSGIIGGGFFALGCIIQLREATMRRLMEQSAEEDE